MSKQKQNKLIETRSQIMAHVHSKDTKPEIIVRKYLYSRGYRYRKNYKKLPGTPDIVLHKYSVVIFIHGCFWHGHDVDGRIPKTNVDFWKNKIERNKIRDQKNKQELLNLGWNVITVWECQLKPIVRAQNLREIEYWINKSYLDKRFRSPKTNIEIAKPKERLEIAAEEEVEYRDKKNKDLAH